MSAAAELLSRLTAAGGELVLNGEEVKVRASAPLSDEFVTELRAHKPELIGQFVRARLLQDLKANPDLVRAAEVIDADSDPVRLIIEIRNVGTCELLVDRQRWDPFRFLELVESGGEAAN